MSTTLLTCAYKILAVGAVSVADLAARFSAVPVDLAIPQMCGLLYVSDETVTSGQTVTRTMQFRALPTTPAAASATIFPGIKSGSPIDQLDLSNGGHDYAAPPLITFTPSAAASIVAARAIALMGVDRGIVIAGGTGYVAPTLTFVGGQLAGDGTQATGTLSRTGTAITGVTITDPGGPYQVPPTAVIADTGGSGAIISPSLKVVDLALMSPGSGYSAAPTMAFNPFFATAVCSDSQPTTQKAHLKNFMTQVFQAALRMPVVQIDPVIS